jgi:hypothetical protein
MSQIIPRPAEALESILDGYFEICSTRGVDYQKPVRGMGEFLANSQLNEEDQTFFWRYFITTINAEFRNAQFNRQDFWQACLDQGLNPIHVMSIVKSKVFRWNGSSVDLFIYIPTEGSLEFLKDPMNNPGAMNQHLQRWDSLVGTALTMQTAYTVPPTVLDLQKRSLSVRLFDQMLQSTGCSNFIQTSSHFQACLPAWFEWLSQLEVSERTSLIIRTLSAVIEAGAHQRLPLQTQLNPERSPGNVNLTLKLIKDMGLHEEDWNSLHDQKVSIKRWMQAYLVEPRDQIEFAKTVAALNSDTLAEQALSALITQPEVAGEVLRGLPPGRAFKLFGETVKAEIGNFPEQSIRKLADLIAMIDGFREVFLAYGMGDFKGHACLDALCVSLDAAEHFYERGFIRKSPDIGLNPGEGIGMFNGRLDAHALQNWRLEPSEAERAMTLMNALGKQDVLLKSVESWVKTNKRPNCIGEEAFHYVVASFFNDGLIDSASVQSWVNSADQVKRLQAVGVSAQALQDCKAFKRNQDDFLNRDLGL